MRYLINGEVFESHSVDLVEVIEQWGATPPFALAVNQCFVARSAWSKIQLSEADCIDIVQPIQGG